MSVSTVITALAAYRHGIVSISVFRLVRWHLALPLNCESRITI